MRTYASLALFALAILVAACGGGGKSGVVLPTVSASANGAASPSNSKSTNATMRLYVPPASQQAKRTRPFYISSSTEAFAIYVEPYPAAVPTGLPSPIPTGVQVFPIATPSPCAVANGGGETCTFTVTAPIGTDLFIVAALPTTTLTGSTVPLSAFLSGPVTVGGSGTPAPLSFTLNGVVYDVALNVASPDPGNTPNTQVFAAASPAATALPVVAYDINGNQIMSSPTQAYLSPIVINASPASEGITLSLSASSSCGSTASGATASIECGADLGDLQVSYDGTPHPDPSDHLYDSFTVSATAQPTGAPSPAHYVLSSNILQWTLVSDEYLYSGYLQTLSNGQLMWIAYLNTGWSAGLFDPSTGSSVSTGAFNTTAEYDLQGIAAAPNGNIWVNNSGPLDCYASSASIDSNTAPVLSGLYPNAPNGDSLYPAALTVDSSGNVWYVAYDDKVEGSYPSYVGYFQPPSSCAAPNPMPSAQFLLSGDDDDYDPVIAPNAAGNGVVVGSADNGYVYDVSTSSNSPVTGTPSLSGEYATGMAVDGAGTAYVAFVNYDNGNGDIETLASGATSPLSELLFLPPTPGAAAFPSPEPTGLYAFSPASGGAADRLMYVDDYSATLGLVESVPASPMPILVSLPNSVYPQQAAYNSHGGEYVLDMDSSENLNMVRVLPTKTWWVPNLQLDTGCSSPQSAILTILERGDSGPFTISIPAASGVTATQFPGADHDFLLTGMSSSTASFTATVEDEHGRQEAFSVTTAQSNVTCGAAHRRLRVRPNQKPHHVGN